MNDKSNPVSPDDELPEYPERQVWAGYDPAEPGKDKTAVGIYSRLPGGSIRLDGVITELDNLTDNSSDGVMSQFPEPSDFVEIPAPQQPGTAREFLARMFEPEPENARLMFRPGDRVALKRPDVFGWIPVGAEGVVESLEHPESVMASKGRHYPVKFDLKPFNIPIDPAMLEIMRKYFKPGEPVPQFHEYMTTHLGANDLELVLKGANWGADYKQPYEVDALAEAMHNMTPADWQRELSAITAQIINGRINTQQEPPEQAPFGFIDPARLGVPPEVLDSTMERYRAERQKGRTPGTPNESE